MDIWLAQKRQAHFGSITQESLITGAAEDSTWGTFGVQKKGCWIPAFLILETHPRKGCHLVASCILQRLLHKEG